MKNILNKIRKCDICNSHLPLGAKPIVQLGEHSRIIIVGQAPGRLAHESGIPWNDASGRKLREWLNVDEQTFYNPELFSILPIGFCYPGKGISGDLAPRKECAPLWHSRVYEKFKNELLVLLIGQFAQRYYMKGDFNSSLTETVKNYKAYLPRYFPLPHPSPRNQNWVKVNSWFMKETIPALQKIVSLTINKK
ncbi:uracil-DNA glycosylase family protein [soil metagenome]